jgi:nucleotide-binding universal stress UspA family protein
VALKRFEQWEALRVKVLQKGSCPVALLATEKNLVKEVENHLVAPRIMFACVDGSELGFKVADYAIALAEKLHPRLIFLNVVGAEGSEKEYSISADMVGSFEVLGMETLAKYEERAVIAGVQSEKLQVGGDPAEQILRQANELDCDCIVIGDRELSRAEKLVVERVAQIVLRKSRVPVIVVK